MKKGFSLIELMIVIMIIGVVYTLAITKLKTVGEEKMTPTFTNLKEYLLLSAKDAKEVRLLCLDDCSSCSIYADGVKTKELKSWFDSSVERYRYDLLQGAVSLENPPFFNKENIAENVCFTFSVERSGISDQVILVYKDKAYDYTDYFEDTKAYDYLQELVDAKEKLSQEVQ
jgi:prepilin-type N-terminal cleavage/methylation domain-containing protein